jgi:hypothetical protein
MDTNLRTITDVKNILIPEIIKIGYIIERVKESEQSIYIYTNKGIIRISDHHNQKSFDNCITSILIPVKSTIAIKMITLLKKN